LQLLIGELESSLRGGGKKQVANRLIVPASGGRNNSS
jgi:hypothetical protein